MAMTLSMCLLYLLVRSRRSGRREIYLWLADWLVEVAPEYIIFWPWRCLGFPIYALIKVKTGKWTWPPI